MNSKQRKQIDVIVISLGDLKDELELLASEESDKYDNLSEGLQASERGQAIEEAAAALERAVSSVDDAINELETLG